jgi:ParB/RepB/Spo0J family partition protein
MKISALQSYPDQHVIYGDLSDAEFRMLRIDIEQHGLRQPIEVTADGIIIDGHQRVRAFRELGIEEIEVTILENLTSSEVKERFLTANLVRRQLDPIAKARAFQALAELEATQKGKSHNVKHNKEFRDRLAEMLGGNMSGRTIDRYLRLLTLPIAIQQAVSRNELTMSLAQKVASSSKTVQKDIAKKIQSGENIHDIIRNHCKQVNNNSKTAKYSQLIQFLDKNLDAMERNAKSIAGEAGNSRSVIDVLVRARELFEVLITAERKVQQHAFAQLHPTSDNMSEIKN